MAVTGTPKLAFAGLTGRDDATGVREYAQIWLVETDTVTDGPKIVKAHPTIPQYGSYYQTATESDPEAYVSDRQADLVDSENANWWKVSVSFSTATNAAGGGQAGIGIVMPEVHEIDLAPKIEWDFLEYMVPAYNAQEAQLVNSKTGQTEKTILASQTRTGLPVANSALDLFDPPLERPENMLVMRLSRAVGSYSPLIAADYANKLNSDTWYGFPPKTLLLKPIRAESVFDKGLSYWRINVEIHISFRGHFREVWDSGMREFITANDIKNIPEHKNKKVGYNLIAGATEPVLLNGEGKALAPKGANVDLKERQPRLWRFRLEEMRPFGPLQLI